MNINGLIEIMDEYRDKELFVSVTGNNCFAIDVTDIAIVENGKTLLLYENSYNTKEGKFLLAPIKTINDLLMILQTIKDKNIEIKGRGTNGVLVYPNAGRICYIDNCAMLNLYDRAELITNEKAKENVLEFTKAQNID